MKNYVSTMKNYKEQKAVIIDKNNNYLLFLKYKSQNVFSFTKLN